MANRESKETSRDEATSLKPDEEPNTQKDTAAVKRLRVVGIGGSAGAVQALQDFFEALPDDCGMAFIVVLHLSPEHKSQMPDILRAKTGMRVIQVNERVRMEANHVYVIPPAKNIRMDDGSLDVADFEEPHGQRMPIDVFFRSHAENHPDGIAIILTGGGTDGSAGIKQVKEVGALVMAQAPDEAEYDAMPRSAIATGVVDVVAPVRELARHAVDYHRRSENGSVPDGTEELDGGDRRALQKILSQLQAWTEHDFAGYKRSTLLRRIARRMHLVGAESLPAYFDVIRESQSEGHALFRDLLISVTSFFRDPEAWASLAEHVVPTLFEDRAPGDTVRVWIAGCATGEEAYSLAILLAEQAAQQEQPPSFQLFATDLDERALSRARQGVYSEALRENVSAPRLERFFEHEGGVYRVAKRLREHLLFAPHNLLKDPPFSKLDLITCRNLLIYLQRDLQQHVFRVFQYALRPGGTLFLGSAESPYGGDHAFDTVDKANRLYRRRPGPTDPLSTPPFDGITRGDPFHPEPQPHRRHPRTDAEAHLQALEAHAPPSVLVDEQRQILHVSGGAGRYLAHPAGKVTADVSKIIRPELADELRTALFRAFDRGEATSSPPIRVRFNGEEARVHLIVRPVVDQDQDRRALLLFAEVDQVAPAEAGTEPEHGPLSRQPDEELQRTREQLRLTTENYEKQREEMQARNEELQSINEEYRSATEELETSKEELQSTNEELQTVNHELKLKVDEVTQAHADLQNLLDATEIATLFLDHELRIQRATQNTDDLFHIRPSDVGRPLAELHLHIGYDDLIDDARRAFEKLEMIEREVQREDGRWLLVRHRPYRTEHDRIAGVLITFIDVTAQKEAEQAAIDAHEYAEHVVDTVREGLLVLGPDLHVLSANGSFYETFGVKPEETEGRLVYELGNGQWQLPELRALLEEILPANKVFNDYHVAYEFEHIGWRTMLLNARRLDHQQKILLAIEDVTERGLVDERVEKTVRERTQQARYLASALIMAEQRERRRISAVLHDHLQQILYGMQLQLSLLIPQVAETLRAPMNRINELLVDGLDITRSLTVELSPPVLKGEGLGAAFDWLGHQVESVYGLKVDVRIGSPIRIPSEDVRVLLFQLTRELLFNVSKHAGTNHAHVEASANAHEVRIVVRDEGAGFDVEKTLSRPPTQGHVGLTRMRERLDLFGGRLELASTPEAGTRATIVFPLDHA